MRAGEITRALGLEPRFSWSAGDLRKTPQGELVNGPKRDKTFWTRRVAQGPLTELPDLLEPLFSLFAEKKDFYLDFRESGGEAELFIGVFGEGNVGMVFNSPLISALASLDIELSLDVYLDRLEPLRYRPPKSEGIGF